MKKYIKENKVIRATDKAYKALYQRKGYKPYIEKEESLKLNLEDLTKKDIKELLDKDNKEYTSRMTKDELINLLEV